MPVWKTLYVNVSLKIYYCFNFFKWRFTEQIFPKQIAYSSFFNSLWNFESWLWTKSKCVTIHMHVHMPVICFMIRMHIVLYSTIAKSKKKKSKVQLNLDSNTNIHNERTYLLRQNLKLLSAELYRSESGRLEERVWPSAFLKVGNSPWTLDQRINQIDDMNYKQRESICRVFLPFKVLCFTMITG